MHALLSHHVVDGDVLAHHACEVEEGEVLHPVVVVHHLGLVGRVGVEVEELSHLSLYALLVVIERFVVEQISLLAFARWVANHTCCATHKDNRLVAATLQMSEHHDAA